jgi:hypothetical protein
VTAELERTNGQHLAIAGKVTPVGIEFPEDMAFDEWASTGATLKLMDSAIQFALGDWLAFGERKYGEMYSQAEEDTGLDYSTLTNYKYVAEKVPMEERRQDLDWSYHRATTALSKAERKVVLDLAAKNDWKKAEVEREVRRLRGKKEPETCTCRECGHVHPGGKR